MHTEGVFMTGATGLIGKWTTVMLTQQGYTVYALARNATGRAASLRQWVDEHGGNSMYLVPVDGDLTQPGLGLGDEDLDRIKHCQYVYHMGAAFDWGISRDLARSTTVGGSRELLELVRRMPALKQFVHMTGYMLAAPHIWNGLGLDPETRDATVALTEDQVRYLYKTFPPYEAAKFEAHFVVSRLAREYDVPLTNIELSGVIGDSRTGELGQPHGLEMMVRALWERKMPVVPGSRQDWMPIIAIDFLSEFVARVINFPESVGKSYVLLDENSPAMAEMVQVICQQLDRRPPSVHMPVALVQWFLRWGGRWLTGLSPEPLVLVQPYRYDTSATLALAEKMALPMPDARDVIGRTARWWLAQRQAA